MAALQSLNVNEFCLDFDKRHIPDKFRPVVRGPRSAICHDGDSVKHHITATMQSLQWALRVRPDMMFRISGKTSSTRVSISGNADLLLIDTFSRLSKLTIDNMDRFSMYLSRRGVRMPRLRNLTMNFPHEAETWCIRDLCLFSADSLRFLTIRALYAEVRNFLERLQEIGKACSILEACIEIHVFPGRMREGMRRLVLGDENEDVESVYRVYLCGVPK